jgi:hypothetical protein
MERINLDDPKLTGQRIDSLIHLEGAPPREKNLIHLP